MKKTGRTLITLGLGMVLGAALLGTAGAATEYLKATRSTQPVYVDGQKVGLEAYAINGSNYVKLRDVGQMVGFNVYWDGSAVQIDSSAPYTGQAPASVQPKAPVIQTPSSANMSVEAMRQDIVDRTNAVRLENGVSALPTDPMLMKAAQVRAEEMAATSTYSHTRPDGSSRLTTTDCPYASENIHRVWDSTLKEDGIGLADYCVDSWAKSSGHFQNMTESGRSAIGVGLARGVNSFGEPCWYCVQWFLRDGYAITWVDTPKIP